MTKYGLLGVAGYVAKKHVKAIYDKGGKLAVCCDPAYNVGFLDSYDMQTVYTQDETEFWLECDRQGVEYIVICTPNHSHYYLAMGAMQRGYKVILEKPPALSVNEALHLVDMEYQTRTELNCIAQIRLNPKLYEFGGKLDDSILMCHYSTPRGAWYNNTWKMDLSKSGGLIFNIGIHLLDIACILRGDCDTVKVMQQSSQSVSFTSKHEYGEFSAMLSIDPARESSRLMFQHDNKWDMSKGFLDAHTKAYEEILSGKGITIEEMLPAIEMAERINQYVL